MVRKLLPTLLALASLSLAACGDYGDVEQGRVIGFNPDSKIVTILKDSSLVSNKPVYDVLPPHEFKLPDDPAEIGALPTPGYRVKFDADKKIITMFNPDTKQLDQIPFELLKRVDNADRRLQTPELFADGKFKDFPVVDEANKTMQMYSLRQRLYAEIKLSPEDFARFKPTEWNAGDEVRIYFKPKQDPTKALRFMNITKTDITRRK